MLNRNIQTLNGLLKNENGNDSGFKQQIIIHATVQLIIMQHMLTAHELYGNASN